MFKRICAVLLLSLLLSSCAMSEREIPIQVIADSVGACIEGYEHLSPASISSMQYCMKSDLSLYREYLILYPFSGTEYNEFGIFLLKDGAEKEKAKHEI